MPVLTIKDTNVYMAGKIVGTVIDAKSDDAGLRVLIRLDEKVAQV